MGTITSLRGNKYDLQRRTAVFRDYHPLTPHPRLLGYRITGCLYKSACHSGQGLCYLYEPRRLEHKDTFLFRWNQWQCSGLPWSVSTASICNQANLRIRDRWRRACKSLPTPEANNTVLIQTPQMSEEIQNAPMNVARSMVASVIINGALAFGVIVALLFCDVNIGSASNDQFPVIAILAQATRSTTAAVLMLTLVAVLTFCASVGSLAASSRMTWSFARDRGLPYWTKLSRVDTRTTIPLNAIATSFCLAALLGLINFGSTKVFNDLVSLQLEALFASYLIPVGLLLFHRTRGNIHERERLRYSAIPRTLSWGPWRVPGILGILNNIWACVYLVIVCFFSFWPSSTPTTVDNMNYSSLVTGAVVILFTLYYLLRARRTYQGPIVETGP